MNVRIGAALLLGATAWLGTAMTPGAAATKKQVPVYLTPGEVRGQVHRHATTAAERKSWRRIATNYGIPYQRLLAANHIGNPRWQPPGRAVLLPTIDIWPSSPYAGVVVNQAENRLYFFRDGHAQLRVPAAVGREDWRTPLGQFRIVYRDANPTWHVPESIQAEMAEAGREVKTEVPPGPANPLGHYWLGLGDGSFGIHSTNAPLSVGRYTTHGCIRLRPQDAKKLFYTVSKKDTVRIVYQPALLGVRGDDEIWLTVRPRIYDFPEASRSTVQLLVGNAGISSRLDWRAVGRALKERRGYPIYVGRAPMPVAGVNRRVAASPVPGARPKPSATFGPPLPPGFRAPMPVPLLPRRPGA